MLVKARVLGNKTKNFRFAKADHKQLGVREKSGREVERLIEAHQLEHGQEVTLEVEGQGSRGVAKLRIMRVIPDEEPEYTLEPETLAHLTAMDDEEQVEEQPSEPVGPSAYDPGIEPPEGMFPCVPGPDPFHRIPREPADLLLAIAALADETPVNIRITGPRGWGKTSIVERVAHKLGRDYVPIAVGHQREAADWTTVIHMNGGAHMVPTAFVHGIQRPNAIVLLDEANRVPPGVNNGMMPFLDHQGGAWSDDLAHRITRAPGVIVVATMNEEDENVGVYDQDAAFLDRFPFEVQMDILDGAIMVDALQARTNCSQRIALNLCRLAYEVHAQVGAGFGQGTSMRTLMAGARLMRDGMEWERACASTVASSFKGTKNGQQSQKLELIKLAASIYDPHITEYDTKQRIKQLGGKYD